MYRVPKDKFDVEAIEQLLNAPAESVIPLLPALLEWMQDMNWPVAEPTVEFLLRYPNEITPLLVEVLAGDDWDWQYWCLLRIIPRLPFYAKIVLHDAVERIAAIEDPMYEDYAEAAKEALQSFLP